MDTAEDNIIFKVLRREKDYLVGITMKEEWELHYCPEKYQPGDYVRCYLMLSNDFSSSELEEMRENGETPYYLEDMCEPLVSDSEWLEQEKKYENNKFERFPEWKLKAIRE